MSEHKGWIGVDLDGTLARYEGWQGPDHIGEPIDLMVDRVRAWLQAGRDVRIFTARVCLSDWRASKEAVEHCKDVIRAWCLKHIGQELIVTNEKDYGMIELWDDRAVQVIPNTGVRADEV